MDSFDGAAERQQTDIDAARGWYDPRKSVGDDDEEPPPDAAGAPLFSCSSCIRNGSLHHPAALPDLQVICCIGLTLAVLTYAPVCLPAPPV